MNNHKITVVGSFAVAMFIKSPRMPIFGETLLGSDFMMGPGGKGSNQAIGISRLGAQSFFANIIGEDDLGDMAMKLFEKEKVNSDLVIRTKESATGVGFVILNHEGENGIILDMGSNNLVDENFVNSLKGKISESKVVISVLEIPLIAALRAMEIGRESNIITILNPAPAQNIKSFNLNNIDYLTPNETELRICLGMAPDNETDNIDLARELKDLGVKNLVVTVGEGGCILINDDYCEQIQGVKVDVVDTTGAGDAFNAGLAVSLAEGMSILDSLKFANCCGAVACTKYGVVSALGYREEIDELFKKTYN